MKASGLPVAEVANKMSISEASVWDLQEIDDELESVYSLVQVRRFEDALCLPAGSLLGIASASPVTAIDLLSAIDSYCQKNHITMAEFSDLAGWEAGPLLSDPTRIYTDFSVDGVRDICRTLGINWETVAISPGVKEIARRI